MAYVSEHQAWADERDRVALRTARRAAGKRHTASHGLTVAAVAFVFMGGAYCLVSAARGAAYSLHHPHPAVVASRG